MSDTSKRWIGNLLDAWNSHDADRVATFYASDYEGEDVAQANPQQGVDGLRRMLARYWQAFPYNGPKNSDTKCGQNKVVKCHHAKTLF